jgi:hypothetical protein
MCEVVSFQRMGYIILAFLNYLLSFKNLYA